MKIKKITEAVNKLKASNNPLIMLDLSFYKIGDTEVKLITKAIEENKTLTTLDLTDNQIGKKGAKAIAKSLEENKTLTTLYLADNQIGTKGAKAIAKALEKNKILTTLNLAINQIGKEGVEAIAQALEKNKTLTTLNLFGNQIGRKGAEAIVKSLEKNKTLTTLYLSNNQIGEEEKDIAEVLEANKKYIKEVANFLSEKYSASKKDLSTNREIKYFKVKKVTKDLSDDIKYFKFFQAVDKNLLGNELALIGIKNPKPFLEAVGTYIKAHLLQLSGVAKDPIVKIAYSRQTFKGKENIFKNKLKEGTAKDSSKAIKMTKVLESTILKEELISNLISEFLGSDQSLFAIKVLSDSEIKQIGENSEMHEGEV